MVQWAHGSLLVAVRTEPRGNEAEPKFQTPQLPNVDSKRIWDPRSQASPQEDSKQNRTNAAPEDALFVV